LVNTSFSFNASRVIANEVPIVSPSSSSFILNDYFKLNDNQIQKNNHTNIRDCHSNVKKAIKSDAHKSKKMSLLPEHKSNKDTIININNDHNTIVKSDKKNNAKSKINENYDAIFKEIEESIIILSEDTEDASTINFNLPRKESLQRNNRTSSNEKRKSVIDIFNDSESSIFNILKLDSEIN